MRCTAAVAIGLLLAPIAAPAQRLGTNVELFGTAGAIGGLIPVRTNTGVQLNLYGGARVDGGFQFSRLGLGAGGRVWEMVPTDEHGGWGIDIFLAAAPVSFSQSAPSEARAIADVAAATTL